MNREEWLHKLADEHLIPMFPDEYKHYEKGPPSNRKLLITCGWPSSGGTGRKRKTLGECWHHSSAKDGTAHIFISPLLERRVEIAAVVLHELCHAVLPAGVKHGPKFAAMARQVGLVGRPTDTEPGEELLQRLHSIMDTFPSYPHDVLVLRPAAERKQTTRMLKLECPECAYTIRTTRKWIEVGLPTCPCGEEFAPEETDDDAN